MSLPMADRKEALAIWRKALPANHPLLHAGLTKFALGDVSGAQAAWHEAMERGPGAFADYTMRFELIRKAISDPDAALTNPVPGGSYDQ
jgi:hypothetical protein